LNLFLFAARSRSAGLAFQRRASFRSCRRRGARVRRSARISLPQAQAWGLRPGGGELRMNHEYETIFIVNSELGEEAIKSVIEKFKAMIESNGQLDSIEEWGARKLSYPIKDKNEGYYVLVNYSAPPDFPLELERVFKITDDILKFLIIRKDV
jgi:small subunit ribosomal protein S6